MNLKTYLLAATFAAVVSHVSAAELDRADRNFFEKAAKSGHKEVAVSQAALAKLTDPAARQFAQQMVNDHTKANAELKALAAAKGVTLPPPDAKPMDKWSEKSGKDFDKDYLKEMEKDHKDAVDLFEKAAKSKDPEIAAFAQKTLPTLQQHLHTVQAEHEKH